MKELNQTAELETGESDAISGRKLVDIKATWQMRRSAEVLARRKCHQSNELKY
jgi:hypothetical protein